MDSAESKHEAATPATGHAEREAFKKWKSEMSLDSHSFEEETWQAACAWQRAALLAEIKATKPWLYGDVPLYRLPEGK